MKRFAMAHCVHQLTTPFYAPATDKIEKIKAVCCDIKVMS
jgi:hypothetical protein